MSRSEKGARFKRRALRRGYKVDEVDEFIKRCEATLAGELIDEPATAADVRDIVFRTRWGGYDEWQVDLHLDRLERELAELVEGGGTAPRGSNGFPTGTIERVGRSLPQLPPGPSTRNLRDRDFTFDRQSDRIAEREPADDFAESFADLADPRGETRFPDQFRDDDYRDRDFVDHTVVPPMPSRQAPGLAELPPGRGASGSPVIPRALPSSAEPVNAAVVPLEPPPVVSAPPPSSPGSFFPPAPDRVMGATAAMGHVIEATGSASSSSSSETMSATPVSSAAALDPYAGRHGKVDMTMEIPTYGKNVSPFTTDDKARLAELRSGFKPRRFGSGYDSRQVNRLFDAMAAAMDGQSSAEVVHSEFDPSQFGLVQGGFFEEEVENALSEMRELFSRRLG